MMRSKFSFFKAGQGSFYGGRIWDGENDRIYTVVYDCGTSPFIAGNADSLIDEITYFKHQRPHSKEIDLLFISHLDYDHVSGIRVLFQEFDIKRIILPYIEKTQRQFFLASVSVIGPPNPNNLSLEEYISFIESPHEFIRNNDENTQIFFIKPGNDKLEYLGYNNNNPNDEIEPRGNRIEDIPAELRTIQNVNLYENNLQFFINKKWEFTTYVKEVDDDAIAKLHNCLKLKTSKKKDDRLSFEDLKEIVTTNRKEAHKCYTKNIGDINSHGLVLLHGPIRFHHLMGRITSHCDLNQQRKYLSHFWDDLHHFRNSRSVMLGTLLLGDTSLNPDNNPIDLPQAFKDKLVNVHVIQVPHHGSSKNWNFDEFVQLNIGNSLRWNNEIISVCNFGYGNKFGHPSHQVLNDLSSTIYLNSQFSRLTIKYDIMGWLP
jgi:hypothetical protein